MLELLLLLQEESVLLRQQAEPRGADGPNTSRSQTNAGTHQQPHTHTHTNLFWSHNATRSRDNTRKVLTKRGLPEKKQE